MSESEDTPRRENDYLGDQPLPTSLAEIRRELSEFLTATGLQVGWMNAVCVSGFLNEQAPIYQRRLFRWITKAFLEDNTGFLRELTKALANCDHPARISRTARALMQSISALSEKGDPVADRLLHKLRDSEWLAHAARKEIRAIQAKLARRVGLTRRVFEKVVEVETEDPRRGKQKKTVKVQKTQYDTDTAQKTSAPMQTDVVKHWEGRTGRSREEINVPREIRATKVKLPKGKSGRPRGGKSRRNRSGG
jgi:hypothetical protein